LTVSAKWYTNAFKGAFNKEADFNDGTATVMLLTNAAVINQITNDFISDLDGNEVTGTGYTADGQALVNAAVTNATNVATFDADDVTWANSTISAQFAILYMNTGTNTTSRVLSYVDFGATEVSSAGSFTITWNASGIATITAA
jgi:hypothetical protein